MALTPIKDLAKIFREAFLIILLIVAYIRRTLSLES